MKKLHLIFGILICIMTIVAITFAIVMFVRTANDTYTSFPAWAVFVIVGIYYSIVLVVLGTVWLVLWLIMRRKICENRESVL